MIRDGENGLVFPGGDSQALEARLRELLSNSEMRRRMGAKGYQRAHEELDEKAYVEHFTRMVEAAVKGAESSRTAAGTRANWTSILRAGWPGLPAPSGSPNS